MRYQVGFIVAPAAEHDFLTQISKRPSKGEPYFLVFVDYFSCVVLQCTQFKSHPAQTQERSLISNVVLYLVLLKTRFRVVVFLWQADLPGRISTVALNRMMRVGTPLYSVLLLVAGWQFVACVLSQSAACSYLTGALVAGRLFFIDEY